MPDAGADIAKRLSVLGDRIAVRPACVEDLSSSIREKDTPNVAIIVTGARLDASRGGSELRQLLDADVGAPKVVLSEVDGEMLRSLQWVKVPPAICLFTAMQKRSSAPCSTLQRVGQCSTRP